MGFIMNLYTTDSSLYLHNLNTHATRMGWPSGNLDNDHLKRQTF